MIIPKILVKVHWEDLESSGRSNDVESSMHFLNSRKAQFTRTAASCFKVKFVSLNRIRNKQYWQGFAEIVASAPFLFKNKQLCAEALSFIFFGDNRILRWISKLLS